MTKGGRGGLGTTLILALLLVVVSVAAGAGLVYLIWKPEPDRPPVVLGIRQLNELATVEYTTQVVVTEEENPEIFRLLPLPEWLTGEQLLLIATGEVEAGIDLGELGPDEVRIVGETVIVDLPDARILGSSLDEDITGLYDRDRGLLRLRGNDELIDDARREAEDRIVETAREDDILEKAQNNAEDSIRVLVTSLGYERVMFS